MDTQRALEIVNNVREAVIQNSLSIAQTECRKLLDMISKDEAWSGVIQYERDRIGAYTIRLHMGPLDAGYNTWGFQFRWAEDALEWVQLLQELGYDWETPEMGETFALAVLAEQKNDKEMISRAEWLETHNM